MTVNEFARAVGLDAQTVRTQIRKGVIRAQDREGRYWILPKEVEIYRAEHLGQAKGGAPRGKRAPRA
jgi:predicted site-specific integrase-resolvase